MVNKTAIIKIDRADHRVLVIRNIAFGVNEAGLVFVDPDTRFHESVIKASRHTENEFFIGNMRNDDTHIHTAQGSVFNALAQIIVYNIKR